MLVGSIRDEVKTMDFVIFSKEYDRFSNIVKPNTLFIMDCSFEIDNKTENLKAIIKNINLV